MTVIGPSFYDRVRETCNSPGTGTVTLLGAAQGYQAFSIVGNLNICYYCIADQSGPNWEVGIGTWNTGGTLTRTAANVTAGSSGAGVLVNFSSGTQDVFLTLPASGIMRIPQTPTFVNFPSHPIFLEPDAIEPLQLGTYTYNVAAGALKYVLAAWSASIGGTSGRMEVRDSRFPIPLYGATSLRGLESGSTAVIVDPAAVTYPDPTGLYYSRLQTLHSVVLKFLPLTSATNFTFLPGPYGAIVMRACLFNAAWICLMLGTSFGSATSGLGTITLGPEINDTTGIRFDFPHLLAVNKRAVSEVMMAGGTAGQLGGLLYYLLPSTWTKIPDATTYQFRDDFMGASLDTASVWNRGQTSVGNVEIDTAFAWCKALGNGNWNANYARTKTFNFARASGYKFMADFYSALGGSSLAAGLGMIGLLDNGGYDVPNFAHSVLFSATGANIRVYENNNNRGNVGAGYTTGRIYRVRITPHVGDQGATYEIQGCPEYAPLGGAAWTDITPGTTSSATNTFYPGFSQYAALASYVGDVRVF